MEITRLILRVFGLIVTIAMLFGFVYSWVIQNNALQALVFGMGATILMVQEAEASIKEEIAKLDKK